MSAYAGSLHTICRVVFWVFRFDQILVIALYFALHFDQIPSCTQYRRNLFYFQASNEFQPFFNTDQLSCRPSFLYELLGPGQVFQALSATENDGPFPRLHRVRLGMACGLEVGFPVKIEFGQAFFRRDDI